MDSCLRLKSCFLHSVSSPPLGFGTLIALSASLALSSQCLSRLCPLSLPPSAKVPMFWVSMIMSFSYNFSWFVVCYPCLVVNYGVFLHSSESPVFFGSHSQCSYCSQHILIGAVVPGLTLTPKSSHSALGFWHCLQHSCPARVSQCG